MNNAIRGSDGKTIGFECFRCGGMYQRMWGETCNKCRDDDRKHAELVAALKQPRTAGEKP